MSEPDVASKLPSNQALSPRFRCLSIQQLAMIDEAVACIGEYGEIRLVVEKGRLRFLITEKSHDVMKWQPGSIK